MCWSWWRPGLGSQPVDPWRSQSTDPPSTSRSTALLLRCILEPCHVHTLRLYYVAAAAKFLIKNISF